MTTITQDTGLDSIKVISHVTAALVGLLAIGSLALSYNALRAVALTNGITGWQSYLWPLLIDASLVVFSLAVVRNALRGERTAWPWFLVGVYTVATVAFNLLHAPYSLTAWAVAIVAPVSLFLSFETLMSHLKSDVKRSAVIQSLADLTTEQAKLTQNIDQLNTQKERLANEVDSLKTQKREMVDNRRPAGAVTSEDTKARAESILRKRVEAGDNIPSGAELGRLLNVSRTTGNRLKNELLPALINTNGSGVTS